LTFTEIAIDDVILNVVNTFKIKAEKFGGQLTCSLDASNTIVQADEMQFTNVIFSLLDNAIKYRRENVPPKLNITTRDVSKNMVEICISDNGIGISKEYQKKIFDKFFRVPTGNVHDVKGFGLGLAYVKRMVTIFGGSISVESFSGEGSSFIIRLPALRVVEENDTDKTETAD
ncbi:MAG: HAMP domain-containing histidine kinase, partial [Muribaculaceae bacterium]|nr:HAMP domain-containing histidine kinase [Muribaculaceae bacterium]